MMRTSAIPIARRALLLGVSSVMAACTLGPDYQRPEIETPEDYLQSFDEGASLANLAWWDLFEDEVLQSLINTALEENNDLAIAVARIEEARARLGFVRADQFPRVDGRAGADRGNSVASLPGFGIQETYVLAADLSWDLDLFGRLRRSTESARAQLLATEEARRAVTITLISDVASGYLLLRDLDARREITERTLETRRKYLNIIEQRYQKGVVPLLDVNQAEIEEADAAARLVQFERNVEQTENFLSVLLGRNPGPILRGRSLNDQIFPPAVPPGLPSELLERRPDVRAAEATLAAQTALIGAAKANRFPQLNLTGSLGRINTDVSDFVDGSSKIWDIGGTLTAPIFDAGKNRAQVEVELARTEQVLRQYEQTILQAFREVEDSLVSIRTYREQYAARSRQAKAAGSASTLSRARYDGGVTSYLEVLDSDRSLFDAQLSASAAKRQELVSVVTLYKALGGGWPAKEEEPATQ